MTNINKFINECLLFLSTPLIGKIIYGDNEFT